MFNGKYKKGMADASKAYQAFGQKQEEALNHILEEVRQGRKSMEDAVAELNGNLDGLYDHLRSKEKASLYTVYTPFDIKELGNEEQLFLLGALLVLTTDKSPNENQQNYIRAVQRYLDIKDLPFGVELTAIEKIESLRAQKAILQTVLEYLRLQDGEGYDETELQQKFLDAFNVSNRVKNEIIEHVELLYSATGAQGLAEKYGYVPEEDPEDSQEEDTREEDDHTASADVDIPEEVADKVFHLLREGEENFYSSSNFFLETKDYFVLRERTRIEHNGLNYVSPSLYSINKRTGERQFLFGKYGAHKELEPEEIGKLIEQEKSGVTRKKKSDGVSESPKCEVVRDYFWDQTIFPYDDFVIDDNVAFIEDDKQVYRLDVLSQKMERVGTSIEDYSLVAAKGSYLVFYNSREGIILLDYVTQKKHILNTDKSLELDCSWFRGEDRRTVWIGEYLYAGYGGCYSQAGVAAIDLAEKKCNTIVPFHEENISLKSIVLYKDTLYVLANVGSSYNKKYNIYAIPCDNPSSYTIIKNNITIDCSSHIKACPRGWVFIENDWNYTLKVFDFEQEDFITLGKGCGYDTYIKMHIWSKSKRYCNTYGFCIIGEFVYYRCGELSKPKLMKVSLSDPSQVELME